MTTKAQPNIELEVRKRYSKGATERVPELCCPIDYDQQYLAILPEEILQRDYGCGDPSRFVRAGETVLDLGSGGGKICYIAAQIVGARGKVIGVDWNDDMLALANKYRPAIAEKLGYDAVEFRKGKIQDLKLDYGKVETHLKEQPVNTASRFLECESFCDQLRRTQPMIPDESIDLVLSNCVLNLVKDDDKKVLFKELYRVLKRGGRVAISDIVSDEAVPEHLKNDPELWSGCISGAFEEAEFLRAFEETGFHGVELAKRDEQPWQVVEGIEFRSVTIVAHKGKEGPCRDHNQAVIYRGPWRSVTDDDGHTLYRGERMAVCEKTYELYNREPYAEGIIGIPPRIPVNPEEAAEFDCRQDRIRPARETKGEEYRKTDADAGSCCGPSEKCC